MVEGLGTGSFVTVTNLAPHSCGCENFFRKIFSNNLQGLTPRVKAKEKNFSVFRYIGQHNAMEILAATWNVVSKISKVLLNDIFAELYGSRQ